MSTGWQCFEVYARNMEAKGNSGEFSNGNGEHGNWKKGDPGYKVVEDLAKMYASVLWKVEFVRDEVGYLAGELSKQSIEGVAWSSLVLTVKCKRRGMKIEQLTKKKKESKLKDILRLLVYPY